MLTKKIILLLLVVELGKIHVTKEETLVFALELKGKGHVSHGELVALEDGALVVSESAEEDEERHEKGDGEEVVHDGNEPGGPRCHRVRDRLPHRRNVVVCATHGVRAAIRRKMNERAHRKQTRQTGGLTLQR